MYKYHAMNKESIKYNGHREHKIQQTLRHKNNVHREHKIIVTESVKYNRHKEHEIQQTQRLKNTSDTKA